MHRKRLEEEPLVPVQDAPRAQQTRRDDRLTGFCGHATAGANGGSQVHASRATSGSGRDDASCALRAVAQSFHCGARARAASEFHSRRLVSTCAAVAKGLAGARSAASRPDLSRSAAEAEAAAAGDRCRHHSAGSARPRKAQEQLAHT